jgi:Phosphotransferase enzyme family
MWRLESIDLDVLEDRSSPDRWGAGDPERDRRVLYDPARDYYVKVWGPLYEDHRRIYHGRTEVVLEEQHVFGLAIGFYDDAIASALVDTIVDEHGRCRGYATRAGAPLETSRTPEFEVFLDAVKAATARTRFAHTDVCYNNLVLVDGRISFIDFDTVFTHVPLIDVEFESEWGCLREHVYEGYREFVLVERARLQARGSTLVRATPRA